MDTIVMDDTVMRLLTWLNCNAVTYLINVFDSTGLDYKNNKLVLPTAPVDLSLDMLQQKVWRHPQINDLKERNLLLTRSIITRYYITSDNGICMIKVRL